MTRRPSPTGGGQRNGHDRRDRTFDEALDEGSVPPTTAVPFEATIDGTGKVLDVTAALAIEKQAGLAYGRRCRARR